MENDFILLLEKEAFIEQLKDIVDKAEDMLSEDTEGERSSDQGGSPQQSQGPGTLMTSEVRDEERTNGAVSGATGSLSGSARALDTSALAPPVAGCVRKPLSQTACAKS